MREWCPTCGRELYNSYDLDYDTLLEDHKSSCRGYYVEPREPTDEEFAEAESMAMNEKAEFEYLLDEQNRNDD